jgi:hypothetical protein
MKAKTPPTQQGFTSVDDFLADEGMPEKFEALAKSEVLEWRAKAGAKGRKSVGDARGNRLAGSRRGKAI